MITFRKLNTLDRLFDFFIYVGLKLAFQVLFEINHFGWASIESNISLNTSTGGWVWARLETLLSCSQMWLVDRLWYRSPVGWLCIQRCFTAWSILFWEIHISRLRCCCRYFWNTEMTRFLNWISFCRRNYVCCSSKSRKTRFITGLLHNFIINGRSFLRGLFLRCRR
jgi:hypothetical protein